MDTQPTPTNHRVWLMHCETPLGCVNLKQLAAVCQALTTLHRRENAPLALTIRPDNTTEITLSAALGLRLVFILLGSCFLLTGRPITAEWSCKAANTNTSLRLCIVSELTRQRQHAAVSWRASANPGKCRPWVVVCGLWLSLQPSISPPSLRPHLVYKYNVSVKQDLVTACVTTQTQQKSTSVAWKQLHASSKKTKVQLNQ